MRPLLRTPLFLLLGISLNTLAQSPAQPLDPRNLDTSTKACADFYQHANGGWLKNNPVPAGFASWGTFEEVSLQGLLQQRALLEQAANSSHPIERLLGDFYASGMNEAAIEAAGATPIQPLLARIDKIAKAKDVAPAIAAIHAAGIPVLFDFGASDDLKNPSQRIAYANQGGLGLSDRDYYLRNDEQTALLLRAYQGYIERLLTLSGSTAPVQEAEAVIAIEKRLAHASLSLLQLRDPNNSYRPISVKTLDKRFPTLSFSKFLKEQGIPKVGTLSLAHETFFKEAESLVKTLSPAQWRAYLRFHVAHAMAPYLSSGYVQAHDALYLRTLRGSQEPMPRWRRVLGSVDSMLGYALGARYMEAHFPESAHKEAMAIVAQITKTLRQKLETAPWLGTQSRLTAIEKLDALDIKIGGSDLPFAYEKIKLSPTNYGGNVLSIVGWMHRHHMDAINTVRKEWQWPQPAHHVNVYYDPARNQLVIPAGLMQAPIFVAGGDTATNYGAFGSIIANQLMHGFDRIGSQFDTQGRIAPWWQEADTNAFNSRFKSLEAQYNTYPVIGQVKVNGHQTLAENITDLAGIEIARDALNALGEQPKVGTLTGAQRYYLSYAQLWRRNYRDDELVLRASIDVQAPAKWRVNGPLANLTSFADAFSCKVGNGSMMQLDALRITAF